MEFLIIQSEAVKEWYFSRTMQQGILWVLNELSRFLYGVLRVIKDSPIYYLGFVHWYYHYGVATVPRIPFGFAGTSENVKEVETATDGLRIALVLRFACFLFGQRYSFSVILGCRYLSYTPLKLAVNRAVPAHKRCHLLIANYRPILNNRPL